MQITPNSPRPTISLPAITGDLLIADDDPDQRAFLAEALRARAYTVREAEHGHEALEMCLQHPPDAALLDVLMPGLDGIEVCRRLKSDPATTHVPVLLITALSDRADRLKGISAGANDFISKPVDVQDLDFRVRNSIHLKRLYDRVLEDNEKLRGIESLRDTLTHLVVRDMRGPLEHVEAALARLREGAGGAAGKDPLLIATGAAATLNVLSQSLLDYNRLHMRVLRLCREPLDLTALARRAADVLRPLATQRQVSLQVPTAACPAEGDADVLHRVLFILTWNALQHAPDNSDITVALEQDLDHATVKVNDRGPAIPEGYREMVFDILRQSRLRSAGQSRSAGPGLAYCRLAIQAHGGDTGCLSDEAGTRFWFTIPAMRT